MRKTGLEPYSADHKPLENRALSNVCVMICVRGVYLNGHAA